jgi:hypothetical protein
LQGVLSAHQLNAASNSAPRCLAVAQKSGGFWAKAMAVHRAVGNRDHRYRHRAPGWSTDGKLPPCPASCRTCQAVRHPVYASVVVGVLIIVFSTIYLATTVQSALLRMIDVTGFLFDSTS